MSDADQHTSELEHKLLKLLNSSYAPNASVTSDNPPQTQNHRRIKVSRGSVRIFIDGFDLVRRGIRLAYLVDTLNLTYGILQSAQDLLNSGSQHEETVLLAHETTTGQSFVVSAVLAKELDIPLILHRHTFIDAAQLQEEAPDTQLQKIMTSMLSQIKKAAATIYSRTSSTISEPPVLNIDAEYIGEADPLKSEVFVRNLMVTLSGLLLEYPFVYYTPLTLVAGSGAPTREPEPGSAIPNLTVAELVMSIDGTEKQIIKFSLPQNYKAANEFKFQSILQSTLRTYDARCAGRQSDDRNCHPQGPTFSWRMKEYVSPGRLAL